MPRFHFYVVTKFIFYWRILCKINSWTLCSLKCFIRRYSFICVFIKILCCLPALIHDHIVVIISVEHLRISFELRVKHVSIELIFLLFIMTMFLNMRMVFEVNVPMQEMSNWFISRVIKMKLESIVCVITKTNHWQVLIYFMHSSLFLIRVTTFSYICWLQVFKYFWCVCHYVFIFKCSII